MTANLFYQLDIFRISVYNTFLTFFYFCFGNSKTALKLRNITDGTVIASSLSLTKSILFVNINIFYHGFVPDHLHGSRIDSVIPSLLVVPLYYFIFSVVNVSCTFTIFQFLVCSSNHCSAVCIIPIYHSFSVYIVFFIIYFI